MGRLKTTEAAIKATDEADPYVDPVSYLAALGIDAVLVSVEENTLGQAA